MDSSRICLLQRVQLSDVSEPSCQGKRLAPCFASIRRCVGQKITTDKESVWDYPRPPRLEPSSRRLLIIFNGVTIAQVPGHSFCEFKGSASYWNLRVKDQVSARAAWSYANPAPAYAPIKNYFALYPSRAGECSIDGELVQSQAGDFYGGWITSDIVGPFKGGPGTLGW